MFRRNNRLFSSFSRHSRRAAQALLRVNRSDAKWMAIHQAREQRVSKWKQIFQPFIPLTVARFKYFWAAMASALSRLIPTISMPAKQQRNNSKGSNRAQAKLAAATSIGYENLEPKQMLATLYVDNPVDYSITTDIAPMGGLPTAGDTVTWAGADGVVGTGGDDVISLTYGTDAFGTIQDAIDAATPADTVIVAPGAYAESPNIAKSLTLQSAGGRDVTTIELQTGPTYLGSLAISGAGNDVTVDGFTIQGIDGTGSTGGSTNITVQYDLGMVDILNNRVQVGSAGTNPTGENGFGLLTYFDTVNDTDSLTVEGNIFEPLTTEGQRAFYVNPGVNAFTFSDNDITGNFVGTSLTQAKDGLVEENMVTGDGAAGMRSGGLGTWGYPSAAAGYGTTTFRANTITNARGINIFDTDSVTVENNFFVNNDGGVGVFESTLNTTSLAVFDDINIHNNSFVGTNGFAVNNDAGFATVDASGNWWGSNSEGSVLTLTSGLVDFTPFLDSGTDTDGGTAGFQGDFSVVNVTSLGAQTGASSRSDEAFAVVGPPTGTGLVNILPGTYAGGLDATPAGIDVTVAPGASPGIVVFGAGLSLNASDTLAIEVIGPTPGPTGHDQLVVTGAVDITGAALTVDFTGVTGLTPGDILTIIDNDGAGDPVVGTFAGLPEGALIGSGLFEISYVGGDGNNVVLIVQSPEVLSIDLNTTLPGNDTGLLGDNRTSKLNPTVNVTLAGIAGGETLQLRDAANNPITAGVILAPGQSVQTFIISPGDFLEGVNTYRAYIGFTEDVTLTNKMITRDTDADVGDDATVVIDDDCVNGTELTTVPFTVSGLDADVNPLLTKVTFSDSGPGSGATADIDVFVGADGSFSADLSTLVDGPIAATLSITDITANTTTGTGDSSVIDTVIPTLVSMSLSDNLITDADDGLTVTLTVVFSEPMDTSPAATAALSVFATGLSGANTTFNPATSKVWDLTNDPTGKTLLVTFEVDDVNVEIADATFRVQNATDACGNVMDNSFATSALSTTPITVIDTLNPSVTVEQAGGQVDPTNASPINFTVTFTSSTAISTFGPTNVTLGGTALPTTAVVTGSGLVYNVAVSGMSMDGTVTVSVAADEVTDIAGNGNDASTSSDNVVVYDTTPPVITSLTLLDSTLPANQINEFDISGTTTLKITFNEDMDPSVIPMVTPDLASAATLTSLPIVSQGWVGAGPSYTMYEIVYDLTDVDAEVADVTFEVKLAEDLAGNAMVLAPAVSSGTSIDTDVEKLTFDVSDSAPQEDLLNLDPPDSTLVNAEVTFTLDSPTEIGNDTVITYMIGLPGTATAGVDYEVDTADPDIAGNPPILAGGSYMGTITIPGGQLSTDLDINILPDFIWEGDETFTVKVVGVTNTGGEAILDCATGEDIEVEILDNEEGADVSIMTGMGPMDNMAAETFQFEIGNDFISPFAPIFNADVISNDGDTITPDTDQDVFDGSDGRVYVTQSLADNLPIATPAGLPNDGLFAPNFGPGAQLSYNNADNGLNARLTAENGLFDVFNLDVPDGNYSQIHLFGAAADGTAAVSVRFHYTTGPASAQNTNSFADWRDSISETDALYYLIDGRDTTDASASPGFDENTVAVYGSIYAPDPTRILDYVEISVDTLDSSNSGDGGTFAFLGASGVQAAGTMGLYTVKLTDPNTGNPISLNENVTVEIDTTTGEAINGTDYNLYFESVPGSGNFDMSIASGGTIFVTIPAGETSVDIKLTAIDDMIIEGGPTNNYGFEDATLTIVDSTTPMGPEPDVGTPDSATVQIKDDDSGKISIVTTMDGDEGNLTNYPGGTLSQTMFSMMTVLGSGTQANPFSAVSTNQGLPSSTAYVEWVASSTSTLFYDHSVSSEANFDFSRIRVNGVIVSSISGINSATGSVIVQGGDVVRYEYAKDNSVNSNADTGTLNSLYLGPASLGSIVDGKVTVNLDKKDTSVTGPTTSSTDVFVATTMTGTADPTADFRTSIDGLGASSLATAQPIGGFWSTATNPNIGGAGAHNTVRSTAALAPSHYYQIEVYANGTTVVVDIDETFGLDSAVALLNANGSIIATNDDSSLDPGSTTTDDSRLTVTGLAAGVYYIRVMDVGGSDDAYTMHVSISTLAQGIRIPAGQSMTMYNVEVIDDQIVEGGLVNSFGSEDVTFTMTSILYSDPNVCIMTEMDDATVTIEDNDSATLSITGMMNGFEDKVLVGTVDGKFSVTLSKPSSTATKVKFTVLGFNTTVPTPGVPDGPPTTDASYGAALDYVFATSGNPADLEFFTSGPNAGMGFITIPAGQTSVNLIVDVNNDNYIEDDETVRIQFATTSPPNMLDPNITVSGTIKTIKIFDEDLSSVSIDNTAFAQEGGQNGVFRVLLDAPHTSDSHTDVEFMAMPSNTLPQAIRFEGSQASSDQILVASAQDIDNPKYWTIDGTRQTTVTGIGNASPVYFSFTVLNDGDQVDINIDAGTVEVFDAMAMSLGAPASSFSSGTLLAGTYTICVDSAAAFSMDVEVENHEVADYDISTTLGNVLSYDPATGIGVVRIPAYTPFGEIIVTPIDDTLVEPTEFVKIKLTGSIQSDSNINTLNPAATENEIELLDNDKVFVKISKVDDGTEPGGPGQDGKFMVQLVTSMGGSTLAYTTVPITVSYSTSGDAVSSLVNNGVNTDYITLSGTVTINPVGVMGGDGNSAMIVVDVVDDFLQPTNESDEEVTVTLTGTNQPTSRVMIHNMNKDTVVIHDNDVVYVTITASDSMAREGNDDGQYKIQLSGRSDAQVIVDLAALLGTGPNADATEGSDYSLFPTTVTFNALQTMKFVNLNVLNDAELEQHIEQAELGITLLPGNSNAGVFITNNPALDSAIVNIKPDPTVSVTTTNPVTFDSTMMGTEGDDNPSFWVTLPYVQNSNGPITGNINLADGDLKVSYTVFVGGSPLYGTPDSDYTALTGMVVIPAGQGFAEIPVSILEDMEIELTENVSIMLESVMPAPVNGDANDGDVTIQRDLYGLSEDGQNLYIVDTANGDDLETIPITFADGRSTGDIDQGWGLAMNPTTWELYALLKFDGIRELFTVDPATGIATSVGTLANKFEDIAFDNLGNLYGVTKDSDATNPNSLFTIDTTPAPVLATTLLTTVSSHNGEGQAIGYSPADGQLHHAFGFHDGDWETLPLPAGTPGTGLPVWSGSPDSEFLDEVAAMAHAQLGNFDSNVFFVSDDSGYFYQVTVGDFEGDSGLEISIEELDNFNEYEGLAFVKSNAFVKIKDNDSGFLKVSAKPKGDDSHPDTVDTGFTIELKKPIGDAITFASTDTTVYFSLDNEATPFLGPQEGDEGSTFGSPQNIDTFPGGDLGGALNWSPNGAGVPHTIIEATADSPADQDYYSFTVLNDGDTVNITKSGAATFLQLYELGGVTPIAQGVSIDNLDLDAGTYIICVFSNNSISPTYSLDVALENHLIADYVLTSPGNDLTSLGEDDWSVTIPAGEQMIMVNVEVFNDTQVEDLEHVTMWLEGVDGDEDIYLGGSAWSLDNDGDDLRLISTSTGTTVYSVAIDNDTIEFGELNGHGLAQHPITGELYAIFSTQDDSGSARGLFIIDPATGDLTLVGNTGHILAAIAFDATGQLWGVSGDNDDTFANTLFTISTVDGSATVAGFYPATGSGPHALAFNPDDGLLYHLFDSDSDNVVLNAIDPVALTFVNIGDNIDGNISGPRALAYDGNGILVGVQSSGNDIFWIDLNLDPNDPDFYQEFGPNTDHTSKGLVVLQPKMIHAVAEICDHDQAFVYVSTDNTLDEALVDPAREPGTDPSDHKDIVINLRDQWGNPVTSQTDTILWYSIDGSATNDEDYALLSGFATIPAGMSFESLRTSAPTPSVFVFNDSVLEGDETVITELQHVSVGDPDITVTNAIDDPNYDDADETGFVVIKDDETGFITIEATDAVAKERDGILDDGTPEPLDPGKFTIFLSEPSESATTVFFEVRSPNGQPIDAEASDYLLSSMPGNNLMNLGGGQYSIVMPAGAQGAMIIVNVVEDSIVEPDETLTLKVTGVGAGAADNITIKSPDTASVTIFDDDVAKVIITKVTDATESTQPGQSPGTPGQFKVSLVDPFTGAMVSSETNTSVRVVVDLAGSTATYNADYSIPGFTFNSSLGTWAGVVTFNGAANGTGQTMKTIDVVLLSETPSGSRPIDVGDETVKLKLDPTYGITTDTRPNDGVVGDNQIELDVMPGGGDNNDGMINFIWDPASPCEDFSVQGMGMNMATLTIFDERFKINVYANDEDASEPGTNAGDNGQFIVGFVNKVGNDIVPQGAWQFSNTIVNYTITGTATSQSQVDGSPIDPADFVDLDDANPGVTITYNPANPAFVTVMIHGQITIPAGQPSVLLDVDVLNDSVIEFDPETVVMTITGLDSEFIGGIQNVGMIQNSSISPGSGVFSRMLGTDLSATVNIFDDDGAVGTPSASDPNAVEPASPPGAGTFDISLLNGMTPIISDTATTFKFVIGGDAILGGSSGTGSGAFGTDGADYILVLDDTTDGTEGFVLNYSSTGAGANMGTITIPAGYSTAKINVIPLADQILEGNELATLTVTQKLAGDAQITVSGDTATVTIEDSNVGRLKIEALDTSGTEGLDNASYRVTMVDANSGLPLVSDTPITATYLFDALNSSATEIADFAALGTMVTILPYVEGLGNLPDFTPNSGDGEAIIPVLIVNDTKVEPTETVVVDLTGGDLPLVSMPAMQTATVQIFDNDLAKVSIKSDTAGADDDAGENNLGPQNDGKFEVILNKLSATATKVFYTVVAAAPNADYGVDYFIPTGFSGFVTIPANTLSTTIDVNVLNDFIEEGTENVKVMITSTDNMPAIIVDSTMNMATISIQDDDQPTFTVSGVGGGMAMANEGDGTITFQITLSSATINQNVDVFLNFDDGTATGVPGTLTIPDTAFNDRDYDKDNTPFVTFPAYGGGTQANPGTDLIRYITIDINDDIWTEQDETFTARLIVNGDSLGNPTAGLPINIINAEALIKDNDTATFTIFAAGEEDPNADPMVMEGTNNDPYAVDSNFTPVTFTIELSNPIDTDVDIDVLFGDILDTATGANFDSFFDVFADLDFGTDYDNETQTLTFSMGEFGPGFSQTITVWVVQDQIVEGGLSSTLPSFGSEFFTASLDVTTDLGDRDVVDSDTSTGTIKDRDADDDSGGSDNDQAKVFVTATDPNAAEPNDIPEFNTGTWTIGLSNPSQTATVVKFQLSDSARFDDNPLQPLDPTDYTISSPTPGSNLTDLGDGMYEITIPASIDTEITSVQITLEPNDDELIEDDEFATLTLVEVVSGDPQVHLSDDPECPISDTIQIDDDNAGLVSIKSDVANGGDPEAAETTPQGGDNGKFVLFLRDEAGVLTNSDTETLVSFTVTLPTGLDPNSNPANGQANPLNDYTLTGADLVSWNPATGMGTVRIPAFTSMTMLNVEVIDDVLNESLEDVTITLNPNPVSNADIRTDTTMDQAIVTIADNGDGIFVKVTKLRDGREPGDFASEDGVFTIQLVDSNGNPTIVPIGSTTNNAGIRIIYSIGKPTDTAMVNSDYAATSGFVVIPEGQGTANVTIEVVNDNIAELDETVSITLLDVEDASGPIGNLPGTGEPIELHPQMDCIMSTLTIEDEDAAPMLGDVHANGAVAGNEWDPLFRDRVDGTEDGSVLGYPLLAGTLGDVIPWINANQLIVEMDQPVDFSTVDLSDFVLTINPGLGPDFLPVLTQPVIVSATPGPQTFVGGTATNTIVLTLDIPLQAGNVDLNILGSNILNTGGVAFSDNLIEFDALPGDVDGNGFVQPTDAQLIVNAGPFAALLPGQPVGILGYDFRLDVNGNRFANVSDAQEVVNRINSLLLAGRPGTNGATGGKSQLATPPLTSSDVVTGPDSGRKGDRDIMQPLGRSAVVQQPLAGSAEFVGAADAIQGRDIAFDQLFGGENADSVENLVEDLDLGLEPFGKGSLKR